MSDCDQPDAEVLLRVRQIRAGIVEALRDIDPDELIAMTPAEIMLFSEKAMRMADEKQEKP